MDRGLYVAAGGMLAELNRQNALSNNLANLSTPGYKPDWTTQREFAQLLWNNRGTGQAIGTWGVGPVTAYQTNLAQGAITPTGNQYDLALDGPGFFAVRTPQGVRYTRNGSFTVDGTGQLVTAQNFPVLDTAGRPLRVGGGQGVEVSADGTVARAGGAVVGRLQIVTLQGGQKVDGSLWTGRPAGQPAGTNVRQRALESSATDAIKTITDITVSQRAFDAGQRVLRAIDDSLSLAARIAQVN